MREKAMLKCLNEIEAVLLAYIEKFGATEEAKLAINRLAIARGVWEENSNS